MTVNRTSQAAPVPAPGSAAANIKGIAWMLVTGLLFIGVTGVVRHLGSDMSPMQAAVIR